MSAIRALRCTPPPLPTSLGRAHNWQTRELIEPDYKCKSDIKSRNFLLIKQIKSLAIPCFLLYSFDNSCVKVNLSNPKTDTQHKITRLIIRFWRHTWICHRLLILTTTTIIYQGIAIYIHGITLIHFWNYMIVCLIHFLKNKSSNWFTNKWICIDLKIGTEVLIFHLSL